MILDPCLWQYRVCPDSSFRHKTSDTFAYTLSTHSYWLSGLSQRPFAACLSRFRSCHIAFQCFRWYAFINTASTTQRWCLQAVRGKIKSITVAVYILAWSESTFIQGIAKLRKRCYQVLVNSVLFCLAGFHNRIMPHCLLWFGGQCWVLNASIHVSWILEVFCCGIPVLSHLWRCTCIRVYLCR